jgi:myo-inositol-1(or 4)-monophosphatase
MPNAIHPSDAVDRFLDSVPAAVARSLPSILAKRNARTLKPDGSYVTTGDLEMQELVLGLVRHYLPGAAIVSEEMDVPQEPTSAELVIVIDPIDGTENFTSGLAEWGISIACYLHGQHSGSLVGCPELNQWVFSRRVEGERYQSRIRALSSSLSKKDLLEMPEGFEYRIIGCCVYNMLSVLRGSYHSFENPRGANAWDILAGLNLALERGLHVTVEGKIYAGEYLTPDRKYRFRIENR